MDKFEYIMDWIEEYPCLRCMVKHYNIHVGDIADIYASWDYKEQDVCCYIKVGYKYYSYSGFCYRNGDISYDD